MTTLPEIIEQLANNDQVLCKNQQRDESDVTKDEKFKILSDIFDKSKANFLSRFGQFLTAEQTTFFEQYREDPNDGYEILFHLKNIAQKNSRDKRRKYLRNKRYAALKRLEKTSYFSETEMMRRNPLLYEQLVGQYLSREEKKIRDQEVNAITFVGALMNGIENEQIEERKKKQEEVEDAAMEEEEDSEDSSSSDDETQMKPSCSRVFKGKIKDKKPVQTLWGEFEDETRRIKPERKSSASLVTSQERRVLKEEFVSLMYQSFLDGEDEEFDYSVVDDNDEFDNLDILEHDEEDKYFDSEEPEDLVMSTDDASKVPEEHHESSEDELDIYMNALNQHPSVCQLSEHMKKL